jgi:hypothetical protein
MLVLTLKELCCIRLGSLWLTARMDIYVTINSGSVLSRVLAAFCALLIVQLTVTQGSSRSINMMDWDKIWAFNKKVNFRQ